jgi:hypothetical protein
MASPFRIFRKYQKTLLVIAGVVLMFVFVVGDSLVSYLTGSRNPRTGDERDARAVAVHWDGGSLTNRQLSDLVFRRHILNHFLGQIEAAGEMPSREAGVDPPELRVQTLRSADTPAQHVEESVVVTKLYAEAAKAAGMKVSDATLLQYLDELGRHNVSREQMRAILNGSQSGGGRASIDYVMDALREAMLARDYLNSHAFAIRTVTPVQRWNDWLKVNDRIIVEAAAIPAQLFLADVKEPTEAEITSYFDKYKNREASPELYGVTELPSPTPGFKIPRKVDLQFVQANYDEFLAKAEEKVTDAEIAKYYDQHKNQFEKANTGLMEDNRPKNDGSKPEADATKGGAKESTNPAKPADERTKAADTETKSSASPAAEKESKPAPATNNPIEGQRPDEKKAAPADEKKSSYQANPSKRIFRLAALEQKAEKNSADKLDTSAGKAASGDSTSPASKAENSANKPAVTSPPAPASNPASPTVPAATPALASPATSAPSATPEASKAAPLSTAEPAVRKPVEYQPLSEVKDEIRRIRAEAKVAEQLKDLMSQVQAPLDSAFSRYNEALATMTDKQEPPVLPKSLTDLAPIARKNGLKYGRTGPKSLLELRQMPVGKTVVMDSDRSLLEMLFAGHELDLYQPIETVDRVSGDLFVVVKMSDTPARVPELAEVRSTVVREWKKERAAELSQQHGEDLAKKAQEAKKPLTKFFADDKAIKVVTTDPFSEYTGGEASLLTRQFQPLRISQPDGIVAAGPEFLKRVFELKDGEVAAVPNHDHSITYIVRVVEHQLGLPELRTAYLADANSWQDEDSMDQLHRGEVAGSLENDVIARANLTWVRVPDKKGQEEQSDEG